MYYGIDIGGTKIELAAFNEKLEKLYTERVPTPQTDYQDRIKWAYYLQHEYSSLQQAQLLN